MDNDIAEQKKLHVGVLGSYPDSVVAFRGDLIKGFVDANHEVTVMMATANPSVEKDIENLGCRFRPYSIKRNRIDPKADWQTLKELKTILKEIQPDRILAYTIKPIIWGSIAARRVPGCDVFALVTGLGYTFQGKTIKRRMLNAAVIGLYRFALRRVAAVIFQNSDNRDEFVRLKIAPASKCYVVNGSGINTNRFTKAPLPEGTPRFLLIARLLGEKGIREYCRAAEIVKKRFPDAIFDLVGPEDPSPDGLPIDEVLQWSNDGTVNYLGATQDVRPFIANSHIYVLPSYHEGMPRTVLEAMAMGRPILTTDVTGCRETVVDGRNGWLVPMADFDALAERMIWFIENRIQWQQMAIESRRIAEEKFDVKKVNSDMMQIMGIATK